MVLPKDNNSKKKQLAEESLKTKKARDKLKKRLEAMDAEITKEAIDRKSIEIHRWISRHADRRITLREKTISLFDENQNAALVSQKVSKLAEKIQSGEFPEENL
ncbi:MAG: hypothetical protein KR126chlam3_00308 [Chlamydiae bacterium]|nr:hypothetical protein [Chlamydiota bacterium]